MSSLIDKYRDHAIDYGMHTAAGDAEGINRSFQELQRTFLLLVNEGQGEELFRLHNDAEPWVQLAAAAHTLEIDEAQARKKLEELAKLRLPHISTDAKYTLEGWDNGTIRFLES